MLHTSWPLVLHLDVYYGVIADGVLARLVKFFQNIAMHCDVVLLWPVLSFKVFIVVIRCVRMIMVPSESSTRICISED